MTMAGRRRGWYPRCVSSAARFCARWSGRVSQTAGGVGKDGIGALYYNLR